MTAYTGRSSSIQRTILAIGPASIVLSLSTIVFFSKEFGSSDSSSSPSIATKPPIGSSLREYFIPSFSFSYIVGPMPIENSCIVTPALLAK